VELASFGSNAFNLSSITVTHVEPAKFRGLKWVVHVACVKDKTDNRGFWLRNVKESEIAERSNLELKYKVKLILKK
jgi:hypothetical protein